MTTRGPAYTAAELLTVTSARLLAEGSLIFAGHGLPTLAVALAQRTSAPGIELVYESGVSGAQPGDLPLTISDSVLVPGAASVLPMTMLFAYILQGGRVDVGFLGAAQIDEYGSLNSTLIGGSWSHPSVRLPGSGGAIEVMAGAKEVFVVMRRHDRSTFVRSLDFCTTPSPSAAAAGTGALPRGRGVSFVVSELAVLARTEDDARLALVGLQPGVGVQRVKDSTGWDLHVSEDVRRLDPPTTDELRILRHLDPDRRYLR